MARFELTISGGEKILVDHACAGMEELRKHLDGNEFILFSEVKVGSPTPIREVIISTRQITLLRPVTDGTTQGSSFRPKR